VLMREGENVPVSGVGTSTAYEVYTDEMIRRFRAGESGIADITDMTRTLRVLNAAQESACIGRAVQLDAEEEEP
jgi:hypothetical protein